MFVVQTNPEYLTPDQRWVERKLYEKNKEIKIVYSYIPLFKNTIKVSDDAILFK